MNCVWYEKHELGKIDKEVFEQHLKTCPVCQKTVSADERVANLARTEEPAPLSPWLGTRIEAALEEERERAEKVRLAWWGRAVPALRFAVVLFVGVVLGVALWPRLNGVDAKLLADSALERVERRERAYVDAIAELEERVQPKLARMDVDLMLLYRDRLETIDAQIAQCREALEENPASAHIRRYMLAALQDKKETLRELLSSRG